jgi:two-component system cell cycle response regulator
VVSPSDDRPALAVLSTAAATLARGADLDHTLRTILRAAVDSVGADLAALFVSDPDRAEHEGLMLQLAATVGIPEEEVPALESEVANDPAHPIARAAATVTPAIARQGTRPDGSTITGADLPLVIAQDGVERGIGIVSYGWAGAHPTDEREVTLLSATADLLATALDRSRVASLVQERAEWYERLAHVDPLTGLANTRTLGRVLELEIARAARQGGEVSVAMFDVDDFGVVNAVKGRHRGDDVLRQVAGVLGGSVRMVDTIARTGADEFVVVAPGSAGAVVARRIIDAVGGSLEGTDGGVTVSAGIARFPENGTNGEELLGAARQALDAARTEGKGRLGEVAAT